MYILGYGTRPEAIKLFPIALELKNRKIPFKTLFTYLRNI
jgi:UDP-N-acetylglucosamine 2-epimerase